MPIEPKDARAIPNPSLRLYEEDAESSVEIILLGSLTDAEYEAVRNASNLKSFAPGELVFRQGDHHDGIFVILSGQVRSYSTGPSGREITLAYWSPGNFVGGPEIFGGSPHVWSGQAVRHSQVLHIKGAELRRLVETIPRFAVGLIEASAHKGKCYSALIQMLGTRSAAERLAQLLLLMAELDGRRTPEGLVISRTLTQEDLAKMIGATRQWVTTSLDRFREQGVVETKPNKIIILNEDALHRLAG